MLSYAVTVITFDRRHSDLAGDTKKQTRCAFGISVELSTKPTFGL